MGDTTIEWADYTYNPWIGCEKVSPGCKNCYASVDTMARQYASAAKSGRGLPLWGPGSTRHITTSTAAQVRAWNMKAYRARIEDMARAAIGAPRPYRRPRVFCASLGDVFESPSHEPARSLIEAARPKLWELIEECDDLDWLLLTKRPENVLGMAAAAWLEQPCGASGIDAVRLCVLPVGHGGACSRTASDGYTRSGWPSHVWLGTSVESQEAADERIPHLLAVPAPVRFLSCEPLLGPVDLSRALGKNGLVVNSIGTCPDCGYHGPGPGHDCPERVHWVIVGGESGPRARPMHPDWARGIRDQCQAAGVAFHFKQQGEWAPAAREVRDGKTIDTLKLSAPARARRWHEWPDGSAAALVGKKAAGRELDGRTWDELPRRP